MNGLRILLLEDSSLDAELILACLQEGGIDCDLVRVETRADFQAALDQDPLDLILADYSLPSFDGGAALALAIAGRPEVPFIFVSGSLGEELAIETLKAGATDYVLKQRLERLVPSVQRALREAAERAERRRLEEELHRRAGELAERDRRKDEFLAMLAHELRNPLGAISNAAELLKRSGPAAPGPRRAVEIIERQIRHQTRLVDDLLDVSRLTRGRISLEPEWLDLGRLVRHTAEDYAAVMDAAGLTLQVELPEQPVWVAGDRVRLSQVLGNLLTNAAKFTGSGGQVVVGCRVSGSPASRVPGCRIGKDGPALDFADPTPDTRHLTPVAEVFVRDTGIGIDPEMQRYVFESFAQADRSLDRSRGGLGLGLALVKGLIDLHGGEVRVHSPGLGRGAEFSFTIPLARETASRQEDEPGALSARSYRILVVEDNQAAAETLCDLLELTGHTVTLAFSGPAGVEAARRVRPEVVLCDIGLPGMDGYAVAQAVRRDPATAAARLIAVSGYGQEEDRGRSKDAGFEEHLVKPINFAELERLLARAPSSSGSAEAGPSW